MRRPVLGCASWSKREQHGSVRYGAHYLREAYLELAYTDVTHRSDTLSVIYTPIVACFWWQGPITQLIIATVHLLQQHHELVGSATTMTHRTLSPPRPFVRVDTPSHLLSQDFPCQHVALSSFDTSIRVLANVPRTRHTCQRATIRCGQAEREVVDCVRTMRSQ